MTVKSTIIEKQGDALTEKLRILLVEDDYEDQMSFKSYFSSMDDMEIVGIAAGCKQGLQMITDMQPDILILDLELQEGDGLELLCTLEEYPEKARPYTIVTTQVSSKVTLQAVREHGSNFEFVKSIEGYSPLQVANYIRRVRKYLGYRAPAKAYRYPFDRDQPIDMDAVKRRLREQISRDLSTMGITPNLLGNDEITSTLMILITEPTTKKRNLKDIFQIICRQYNTRPENITRNIKSAIETAWAIGDMDILKAYYPGAIHPERGNPSNKEFIYTMVGKYASQYQQLLDQANRGEMKESSVKSEEKVLQPSCPC